MVSTNFSHELETAIEQLGRIERSFVAAFPHAKPGPTLRNS